MLIFLWMSRMRFRTSRSAFLLLFFLFSASFCPISSLAQKNSTIAGLRQLVATLDTFQQKMPAEKVLLHLDKPYYATGDTIWLKAYLFDAATLSASRTSGLLYIELENDSSTVLQRFMLPVISGLTWGNIALPKATLAEGSYTIRAYTNWMRNLGTAAAFTQRFYVSGTGAKLMVNSDLKKDQANGKEVFHLGLQLSDFNKQPLVLKDLQVKVLEGDRTLYKENLQTSENGWLRLNFTLPEKVTKPISLLAESNPKEEDKVHLHIPLILNLPKQIDLQFMPEGGNLVSGLATKIGFKAIGEDGNSVPVEGQILDGKQQVVATFKSVHNGMAFFNLIPEVGENYTARLTLPEGAAKTYPLPDIKSSGMVLRVNNIKSDDSLEVWIKTTLDLEKIPMAYYLIGQARGVVCYASVAAFKNKMFRVRIAKELFPTGIVRFTLLSATRQPINERVVFIDHHDGLKVNTVPDKKAYYLRDSIALTFTVKDNAGQPVNGSFSMAVTDDSQVNTDKFHQNSIWTDLLLTSDLKGTVEGPDDYANEDPLTWQYLDNLMLTQGWVAYSWKEIFTPPEMPEFPAQDEFKITGKVVNTLGKPMNAASVLLLSKKPFFMMDALSDADGRFVFKGFTDLDTTAFRIQARNKRGKSFGIGLEVDKFFPPAFAAHQSRLSPWYLNSDSTLLNYMRNAEILQKNEELPLSGHLLKEVQITARKIVKNSFNLNKPGNADQVLNEVDMKESGNLTLLQILDQKVTGFRIGHKKGLPVFMINEVEVLLSIDGQLIRGGEIDMGFESLKDKLNDFSAEALLGVEVMYSNAYRRSYLVYNGLNRMPGSSEDDDYAFLEITTTSGVGWYTKKVPGVDTYRPLPISRPIKFYRPRYTIKNRDVKQPDLRSTIHWEPNIVTDKTGKATVSFYAADHPGTYTVIFKGSNMQGNFAEQKVKLVIAAEIPIL